MATHVIFVWVFLGIYSAGVLYFVIRGALKTKTIDDYAVGNFAFSPVAVGLSLAAAITSAATFIINPGWVGRYGLSAYLTLAIFMPFGALISLVILTKGFRKYGSVVKAGTMAQWMGARYNSKAYSFIYGILSLLIVSFIVLILVGLTKVVSKATGTGETYVLISVILFVFGYMMFGGANSMIYTNTIQAIIMLVVAFVILGSGYSHFTSGGGLMANIKKIDPLMTQFTYPNSAMFKDIFEILIIQLVVGFAIICQPHIMTKSLMLKSEKDINKFLVVGIIVEIIFFSVIFAGLYARIHFPELLSLPNGKEVFLPSAELLAKAKAAMAGVSGVAAQSKAAMAVVAGKAVTYDGLMSAYVAKIFSGSAWYFILGLVVVTMGLIAAGMSTLEGLIQSLSTTITSDVIVPIIDKKLPKDEVKRTRVIISLNRIVIVLIAIGAFLLTRDQLVNPSGGKTVSLLAINFVYAFFATAIFPIFMGTFFKKVHKTAAITATLSAFVIHFGLYFGFGKGLGVKYLAVNPAVSAFFAIVGSFVIGTTLYFVLKDKAESVDDIMKMHE